MSCDQLMPTTIISRSEEYQVSRVLGIGYYGRTFKCKTKSTRKSVAIKIIKRREDAVLNMYEKEVEVLQRLQLEDNEKYKFLKILDNFEYQQQQCIVLELLGLTLHDHINSRRVFTAENICYITSQLLVTLQRLHQIGILHEDLSAKNIMFVSKSSECLDVKIIDFGNAMWTTSQTRLAKRCPDRLLELRYTASTEMWELGAIMATLLVASSKSMLRLYEFRKLKYVLELQGFTFTTTGEEFNESLKMLKNLEHKKALTEAESANEISNRIQLVDLLMQMLTFYPNERINAEKALQHNAVKRFVL